MMIGSGFTIGAMFLCMFIGYFLGYLGTQFELFSDLTSSSIDILSYSQQKSPSATLLHSMKLSSSTTSTKSTQYPIAWDIFHAFLACSSDSFQQQLNECVLNSSKLPQELISDSILTFPITLCPQCQIADYSRLILEKESSRNRSLFVFISGSFDEFTSNSPMSSKTGTGSSNKQNVKSRASQFYRTVKNALELGHYVWVCSEESGLVNELHVELKLELGENVLEQRFHSVEVVSSSSSSGIEQQNGCCGQDSVSLLRTSMDFVILLDSQSTAKSLSALRNQWSTALYVLMGFQSAVERKSDSLMLSHVFQQLNVNRFGLVELSRMKAKFVNHKVDSDSVVSLANDPEYVRTPQSFKEFEMKFVDSSLDERSLGRSVQVLSSSILFAYKISSGLDD